MNMSGDPACQMARKLESNPGKATVRWFDEWTALGEALSQYVL
jgi:hypothetical protein